MIAALQPDRQAMMMTLRMGVSVVAAIAVSSILLAAGGFDLQLVYEEILRQSLGSPFAIKNSLIEAVPITLVGLGVAVAFRAGIFNLGGEGQIYMGALAAIGVALGFSGLPGPLLICLTLIAGIIGGALWGGVAGALRSRLGLSEIITTIMLNFIAFWIVSYLVRGPIQDPNSAGYPYTAEIPGRSQLPIVGDLIPTGFLIAVIASAVAWVLLERTKTGIGIKSLGSGEAAGRFAGFRVEMVGFGVMLIAGAMSGLAGAVALLGGGDGRLSDFFSPGWGFIGVMTALIGRGSPIGTLLAGLFVGFLTNGISGAQGTAGVPNSVAQMLLGLFVLFLIISNTDFFVRLAESARASLAGSRPRRGKATV